jgi:hypothetical protein
MVAIHDFADPGSSQNRLPGKKMDRRVRKPTLGSYRWALNHAIV